MFAKSWDLGREVTRSLFGVSSAQMSEVGHGSAEARSSNPRPRPGDLGCVHLAQGETTAQAKLAVLDQLLFLSDPSRGGVIYL